MDSSLSRYWVWEIVPTWWNGWLCSVIYFNHFKSSHCPRSSSSLYLIKYLYCITWGSKGIERASKVMMPLLFIIFVVIIERSPSLPNAMEGVLYFLKPDFSKLTSAGPLYALGQSFFALSLGVTVMLTYASYLDKKTNLVQSGISIVAMNISISIMAGLAISSSVPFRLDIEGDRACSLSSCLNSLTRCLLEPFSTSFSSLRLSLLLSWCWRSMWAISPTRITANVPNGVLF